MGSVSNMFLLYLCLLLARLTYVSLLDPWNDGPFQTKHKLYNGFLNNGLDHELDVWAPNGAGSFPVIYFLGGLGGIIPGIAYDTVMKGIASHGFIVLDPWAVVSNPVNNYEAEWLVSVQEWVEIHLEDRLHGDGFNASMHMDNENVFLMGHSAGAHVIVEYLKHHCNKVKGQILFSPVDGFDPFGLVDMFAITPGEYLNYDTPTLLIMTGLDNTPGSNIIGSATPACAPDELSNLRFYNAMPSNTWLVNATAYGHGDCLDELYYNAMQLIHFCGTDKDQDRVSYRSFISGEIVSFLSAMLYDCNYLMYIEDPSTMPVLATTIAKDSSTDTQWTCGVQGYCNWREDPYP